MKREPAGTSRAGAARRRTGVQAEKLPAVPSEKPSTRRGDRPRRAVGQRPAAEHDLALRMLDALRTGADVRARKVRRLKAAIKVRAYENDLKFQVAFERMKSVLDLPAAERGEDDKVTR